MIEVTNTCGKMPAGFTDVTGIKYIKTPADLNAPCRTFSFHLWFRKTPKIISILERTIEVEEGPRKASLSAAIFVYHYLPAARSKETGQKRHKPFTPKSD